MKKLLLSLFAIILATVSAQAASVRINVDQATNVEVSNGGSGQGEVYTLSNGMNTIDVDVDWVAVKPVKDAEILSIKFNDNDVIVSGDGVYRCGPLTSSNYIEITTKAAASYDRTITFNLWGDPVESIVVTINGMKTTLNEDNKIKAKTNDVIGISAAPGWKIINCIPGKDNGNGVYTFTVAESTTVIITVQSSKRNVDIAVDDYTRLKVYETENPDVVYQLTDKRTQLKIEQGTKITIAPSSDEYRIIQWKKGGIRQEIPADYKINEVVDANVLHEFTTSTTNSTICTFEVDDPSKLVVNVKGKEEFDDRLDVTKAYEFEAGTTLIIKPIESYIITSLKVNGAEMPASNPYEIKLKGDMHFTVETKEIRPIITFDVDNAELIKVTAGGVKLEDLTQPLEVRKGTAIVIEPARSAYEITSIKANGEEMRADASGKYNINANADLDFEIRTAANLPLTILESVGGSITVSRNGVQLATGATVRTGDVLELSNKADAGLIFANYKINDIETTSNLYTVAGSAPITIQGLFREPKEGFTLVNLNMASPLIKVEEYYANDTYITNYGVDYPRQLELEAGHILRIRLQSEGVFFKYFTVNGVAVFPDEENEKQYTITVEGESMTIAAETFAKAYVYGEKSYEDIYTDAGAVYVKYNGKEYTSIYLAEGETVELVAYPEKGFQFEYFYRKDNYGGEIKYDSNTYTVTAEDIANQAYIGFWGKFSRVNSVDGIEAAGYNYDATTSILTTANGAEVYTMSGQLVVSSNEQTIDLSSLNNGIYVVKANDNVFKIVKK